MKIQMIIARVAKLALSYTLKARIEHLVELAYEAGQADRTADIRAELLADGQGDAAMFIDANWA